MTNDQKFSIEIHFNVGAGLFESGCKNLEKEIQDELEKASTEILSLAKEIKKLEKELSQPPKTETTQSKKDTKKSSKEEIKVEEKGEDNE